MRLKSVEFEGFACFERQRIEIREGLTVLVGQNNSGKTALLKGLTLLGDLMIEPRRAKLPEFVKYVRSDPNASFGLNVIFGAEESDATIFQGDDGTKWRQLVARGTTEFIFRFIVFPSNPPVVLDSCTVFVRETPLDIYAVDQNSGQQSRRLYNYDSLKDTQLARISGDVVTFPDGKARLTSLDWQNEGQPFRSLKNVRYISPHRVADPLNNLVGAENLASDAGNLAGFLHNFRGRQPSEFAQLQSFVLSVFPQFNEIRTVSQGPDVGIELGDRLTGNGISLSHCGTGVEQILSLAAAIVSSPPESIILLDEPHSYLHPIAERKLIEFLHTRQHNKIFVSTHSATFINSVTSDRIVYLQLNPSNSLSPKMDTPRMLFELGHRNSDLLFNDRLVFVEGPSDKVVLPILLAKNGTLHSGVLNTTGFVEMNGGGRLDGRSAATSILYYERTLQSLGRALIPHIYVFDGDKSRDEKTVIDKVTKSICYLETRELENYLLVPLAILPALKSAAMDRGLVITASAESIDEDLQRILADTNDKNLFPGGVVSNPIVQVQGSIALKRLFSKFELSFSKTKHGPIIAQNIPDNSPMLGQLSETLKTFLDT